MLDLPRDRLLRPPDLLLPDLPDLRPYLSLWIENFRLNLYYRIVMDKEIER